MTHFHISWYDVRHSISFKNLIMLSSSVPKYKSKAKAETRTDGHLGAILGGAKK